MSQKFLECAICGNIVGVVKESGKPISCCGQPMQEIIPGAIDAAVEKHVPEMVIEGSVVTVNVGSVAHPMTEEHLIEWISLQTKQGNQRKVLTAADAPQAVFALAEGDEVVAAYAYCNKHGLWVAQA